MPPLPLTDRLALLLTLSLYFLLLGLVGKLLKGCL